MDETQATETNASTFLDQTWAAVSRAIQGDAQGWSEFLYLTIVPAAKALAVLFVCYLLGKLLSKMIARPINERVDTTLGRFVEKLIYRGTIAAGFLFVLSQFGVKSTSFAAVLAAMGFAIGLALQGTLGNFASGILLLVFRPFKVGDMVVAGTVTGKVTEIDLFTTAIDTLDNRRLIVPNSSISGQTIENVTYHPVRRFDLALAMPWHADLDKTRAALLNAIDQLGSELVNDDDHKSAVWIVGVTGAVVDWQIQFWVNTADFRVMREKAIIAVKRTMDEANLSPAVPRYRLAFEEEQDNPSAVRTTPRRSHTATRPAA